jgi:hypothetical protein
MMWLQARKYSMRVVGDVVEVKDGGIERFGTKREKGGYEVVRMLLE